MNSGGTWQRPQRSRSPRNSASPRFAAAPTAASSPPCRHRFRGNRRTGSSARTPPAPCGWRRSDPPAALRECRREQPSIVEIDREPGHDRLLATVGHHLDRMLAEQRQLGLVLQAGDTGIGPGQPGQVGDVGQPLAVARMALPGEPDRHRAPVRERQLGLVARGAGHVVQPGHPPVVKQPPPELDLGRRHRVVSRHGRRWHPRGQGPSVAPCSVTPRQGMSRRWAGPLPGPASRSGVAQRTMPDVMPSLSVVSRSMHHFSPVDGDGAGWLIVDTWPTRSHRPRDAPQARFATVYAKPAGRRRWSTPS